MTTIEDAFGALRATFERLSPNTKGFHAVREIIEDAYAVDPGRTIVELVPYAQTQMKSWEPYTRYMTLGRRGSPAAMLATRLSIAGPLTVEWVELLRTWSFPSLKELNFNEASLEAFMALAHETCFLRIETLMMTEAFERASRDDGIEMIGSLRDVVNVHLAGVGRSRFPSLWSLDVAYLYEDPQCDVEDPSLKVGFGTIPSFSYALLEGMCQYSWRDLNWLLFGGARMSFDVGALCATQMGIRSLQTLNFNGVIFEEGALEYLATQSWFATVRELEFNHCQLTDSDLKVFSRLPWSRLECFKMGCNALDGQPSSEFYGDEGMTAFSSNASLSSLRILAIDPSNLGSKGWTSLATSPSLECLKRLVIPYHRELVDDEGVVAELIDSGVRVNDAVVRYIFPNGR